MKKIPLLSISTLFLLPLFAHATVPAFPMAFWGNVTIDNNPAPVGTVIRIYYRDVLAGQVVVQETGIYGYIESTKQKLTAGEGNGELAFKFQSASYNNGDETAGVTTQTYSSFMSGEVINKDLLFTLPVSSPPSGGNSGGGGSSSGGGGGGVPIQNIVAQAKKGDTNGDSNVDIFDFNILMVNWGSIIAGNPADLDGNNSVDIFDFNLLMINWGK